MSSLACALAPFFGQHVPALVVEVKLLGAPPLGYVLRDLGCCDGLGMPALPGLFLRSCTCERCEQRLRGMQQAQAGLRLSPKALKSDKA